MIKRYYFLTYKTEVLGGVSIEGNLDGHLKSWFPDPDKALAGFKNVITAKVHGRPFFITSFYRVR